MIKKFTRFLSSAGALWLLMVPGPVRAQQWQWAVAPTTAGTTGTSTITASGLDPAGNTVVAGTFSGALTLGAFTVSSAGAKDLFVARISNAGVWLAVTTAQSNANGNFYPAEVACQANGEVLVGGSFAGTSARFGSTLLTNADAANPATTDLFVARLGSTGQWTQAVRAGGTKSETLQSLVVNAAGDVLVGGGFAGQQCRFGSFSLNNVDSGPYPSPDLFVARLNPAGTWTQAVGLGGGGGESVAAMAVLSDGTLAVTGGFNSYTLQFGSTPVLYNVGYYSGAFTYSTLFIARLSAAGTWVSAFAGTSAGAVHPTALVADPNGDVVVAGYFSATSARFGSTVLTNSSRDSDGFVARLSGLTTTPSWSQAVQCGAVGFDKINALALDHAGNAVVTGNFTGATTRFGAIVLANATTASPNYNTEDVFVARLSRAGAWTHALRAGGTGYDLAHSVAVDALGRARVVGTVLNPATFGTTTLAGGTAGQTSGFVALMGGLPLASAPARPVLPLLFAPNPATATVRVTLPTGMPAQALLVIDALGRTVCRQAVPAQATAVVVDVERLPSGLYTVRYGNVAGKLMIE